MVVHLHVGEAVAGEGGLGHDAGEGELWDWGEKGGGGVSKEA